MAKILGGNFEKRFLEREKIAKDKTFWHFLYSILFMFILLQSNHTVFLVQFGINLHCFTIRMIHSVLNIRFSRHEDSNQCNLH